MVLPQSPFNRPQLPFRRDEDKDEKKVTLTAPVFLSCGCGSVVARWASLQQNMAHKLPQGKPKSSKIITEWINQEGLRDKWPELKQHTFGLVVAETPDGFKKVNIMNGATNGVLQQIAQLLEENAKLTKEQNV